MYGKLAVAAGFAAGYVLGSKAGRQRYEEIVSQARKVAGNETVQSTAGVLQAKGTELVDKAKQSDIANKVKSTVARDKSDAPTYETAVVADPLVTETVVTDTVVATDPYETTDPFRPANVNGTNNI